MAIPTFNNGDNLGAIRRDSLNPTITLANKLEDDLSKLSAQVHPPLTADEMFVKFDRGVIPDDTATLTGLDSGWWFVPSTNTVTTGKPPGVVGDFIFYKQLVTGSADNPRAGVIVAYGNSTQNVGQDPVPTIWTRYKVGGSWTPWASGVRALIDLNDLIQQVSRSVPKMTDIENYLISQGWKKEGAPVIPVTKLLPKIYATYDNNIPVSLSGLASSTTGMLTLNRGTTEQSRIMILVAQADADRVSTIQIDDGLASNWVSRTTSIGGIAYKVFYSAGAYSERTNKVKVNFN